MDKIIRIEKNRILNKTELKKITKNLIKLNSNLMVFGLPWSGKSTIIKAILKKSSEFITLEEEEVLNNSDYLKLRKEIESKKWAVSHQMPSLNENVLDDYLRKFLKKEMDLDPKKWTIIRIKTNS